jgi:hypothetical protein
VSLCEPELDAYIAPIDLPERSQGAPKNRREWLDVVRRADAQDAHERQVSHILRKCWNSSA